MSPAKTESRRPTRPSSVSGFSGPPGATGGSGYVVGGCGVTVVVVEDGGSVVTGVGASLAEVSMLTADEQAVINVNEMTTNRLIWMERTDDVVLLS